MLYQIWSREARDFERTLGFFFYIFVHWYIERYEELLGSREFVVDRGNMDSISAIMAAVWSATVQ